jgi:hypothetical protein
MFAPSLDLGAAERFQAAITDECPGVGASLNALKATGLALESSVSAGSAPQSPAAPCECRDCEHRTVDYREGERPREPVGRVALNAPETCEMRRSEDTPPYRGAPAQQSFKAFVGHREGEHRVVDYREGEHRAVGHREGERPREPVGSVVPNAPETFFEPVQIIAPSPLPIESSVIHRETAVSVPSEVTRMFVAAAEAVADAMLVSSGFKDGEGRMIVRLRPEVLKGSEVHINAKGGTLTIVVNPATQDVQNIVEANRTQFEQHLAEKIHSWRVAVAVRRGVKSDERI